MFLWIIGEVSCPGRHPTIEQFPKPLMSQNVRAHGGIALYIFITAYTFLAVAITCDEFFVPSLEIICDGELKCFLDSVLSSSMT